MADKIFTEVGVSGLRQQGGVVDEERLRKLQGDRGRRIFREMADNDDLIGAILFAIEMMLRNVEWRVEPATDDPDHVEVAEFFESLMDDMSHTWEDFVSETLTMLVHGFAPHEIVYKRREGPAQSDPTRRSRHDDGRIGWRKIPLRSQDTLDRWEFDDDGGIKGMWQLPPSSGGLILIPIEKMLIFRTTSRKNNPEGRSVLRNAYVSWFRKKRIAEFEAIGVERDLAGMPIFYLPSQLFDPNASADVKSQLSEYQRIIENIKNDEQAGLILPAVFDENNNRLVEFTLAGTGSRRLFDTSAIISRYDRSIAMTVLADFILLGHEKVGSFALSSDKTSMFATALGAWLKEIAAVINRHAVPRLMNLNAFPTEATPSFVPGDLEKDDVSRFAEAVSKLTGMGWLTPGSEDDENHIRNLLDMPSITAFVGGDGEEGDEEGGSRRDPAAALNGAQVQALIQIAQSVAVGELDRNAAISIIVASFPITRTDAENMLSGSSPLIVGAPDEPQRPE